MNRKRIEQKIQKTLDAWRYNSKEKTKKYQCRNSYERAVYHIIAQQYGFCSATMINPNQIQYVLHPSYRQEMDDCMERLVEDSSYSREIQDLHKLYDVKTPVTYVQIYSPSNSYFKARLMSCVKIKELYGIIVEYLIVCVRNRCTQE